LLSRKTRILFTIYNIIKQIQSRSKILLTIILISIKQNLLKIIKLKEFKKSISKLKQ